VKGDEMSTFEAVGLGAALVWIGMWLAYSIVSIVYSRRSKRK